MFHRIFIFFIIIFHPLCALENQSLSGTEDKFSFEKIILILEEKKSELLKNQHHKDLKPFTCLPMNLKKGQKDPLVSKIRKKLIIKGFIPLGDSETDLFDHSIERGIKKFQEENTIHNDGIFGPRTCQIFNQSETDIIKKIEKTIEHIKDEIKKDKKKKIIVNVGTFQAFTIDENGVIDHIQAAVVGMKTRRTPLMESKITQIVFNPYWGVPNSILFKDKIQKIIKNPQYLEEREYQVFDSSNTEIDPEDIEWEKYTEKNFPYYIRQLPGEHNALGNIKFILNNKNAIYLHGSAQEKDFQRKERTFSSGCVRLEFPIDIALWILKGTPYTEEKIDSFLDLEKTVYIDLHKPIETHIVNWPVFINENKQIIFGNSFYTEEQEDTKN